MLFKNSSFFSRSYLFYRKLGLSEAKAYEAACDDFDRHYGPKDYKPKDKLI